MRRHRVAAAVLVAVSVVLSQTLVAGAVVAQSAATGSAAPSSRGLADDVVVTATRVPQPAAEVLAPVVVIDRETIERSLAPDVADLLRFHAGLELARNGGPGQTTSLFIRGTDSNHAIFLVDGVRVNPGTIGGAALQNVAPELVERIEIVKGPRSTL
ncbi:MAG: TonB-dependent receptor plug domain-containing protein, partial [Pseudomonadota bacterium]